jgi:SAM-dependent methyltransferase
MTDALRKSWSSFSPSLAARYLKTYGWPSAGSKALLVDVLEHLGRAPLEILDLGCGNAQLYEYFKERGLACRYTGVDFSDALLAAARAAHDGDPNAHFLAEDIEVLDSINGRFDVVVYSHVLEMVESPERTLSRARELAPMIIVRFFEPPAEVPDTVELLSLEVDEGRTVPYLRRTMSRDYYRLLLAKIGCLRVDVYDDPSGAKDEVHVLFLD